MECQVNAVGFASNLPPNRGSGENHDEGLVHAATGNHNLGGAEVVVQVKVRVVDLDRIQRVLLAVVAVVNVPLTPVVCVIASLAAVWAA